jgi:hypothetical protein
MSQEKKKKLFRDINKTISNRKLNDRMIRNNLFESVFNFKQETNSLESSSYLMINSRKHKYLIKISKIKLLKNL